VRRDAAREDSALPARAPALKHIMSFTLAYRTAFQGQVDISEALGAGRADAEQISNLMADSKLPSTKRRQALFTVSSTARLQSA
jgi:hypothetical protein